VIDSKQPIVSVITPLFNEESVIPHLATRLKTVFDGMGSIAWEWVAVDDGSKDGTFEAISEAIKVSPKWQVIRFSRNFGQQAAYRAGVEKAVGKAIIFLDADMQDPPEKIPEMFALWQQGFEHVVGSRRTRKESGIRGLCMKVFHEIFHRVTHGVMPKNSGTFGLMDRRLADELVAMPERGMFLPAQRAWLGFKTTAIFYDRGSRPDEPKQSYSKLFSYAWEGITSFSVVPLHMIFLMGLIVSLIGFGYAAVLLLVKILQIFDFFSNLEVPGFTTLSVAMLCLGGIQLLSIGVIGSYIAKIYQEVKRRPHFVIANHVTG
jgi:glycosyltransferase involved in cell wall biosynthesis